MLTDAQLAQTVDAIAAQQTRDGLVLWFPGGHADPWNHVEAAMALAVGGRLADAERAYQWLADAQRPDGSWHNYYLADRVEDPKLDTNVIAYVATGVWHHWLLTQDRGFVEAMWPVVDAAVEVVLGLQTARGEILYARHPDGTPWPFALLTGCSSIWHSLGCALELAALLGHGRPAWADAADRLGRTLVTVPDAFAPKDRWAMDWYYPVLGGALDGEAGRARLLERWGTFVMDGVGVRCVSDRPWVTAAETCECVMALLRVGETERAADLFRWAQALRDDDGSYWTGITSPDGIHFPGGERSSYTAAAVVLAADALDRRSAASGLFVDPLPHALVLD